MAGFLGKGDVYIKEVKMKKLYLGLLMVVVFVCFSLASFANNFCWSTISGSQWRLDDTDYVVIFEKSCVGPSPAANVILADEEGNAIWIGWYRCSNGVVDIYDKDAGKICSCMEDELGNLHCFSKPVTILRK